MKAKNLEVGLEVQVKDHAKGFDALNYGKVGTIVELDHDSTYDVRVKFEGDNSYDWGNRKGIRKYNIPYKVGDTVKVLRNGRGFDESNYERVGTVIKLDVGSSLDVKVDFGDDADWGHSTGLELYSKPASFKIGDVVRIRKTTRSSSVGFSTRHDTLVGIVDVLDSDDTDLNVKLHLITGSGGIAWGNTDELVVLKEVDAKTPKGTRVVGTQDGFSCVGTHSYFKGRVGVIEDTLQSNNLVGIRWDNLGGDRNRYMGLDASMVRVLGE